MRRCQRRNHGPAAARILAVRALSARRRASSAVAAAPALALAFWRNALAVGVLGPVGAVRGRDQFARLFTTDRRTLSVCVLSGLALAVHFGTWVPSAKLTTVDRANL